MHNETWQEALQQKGKKNLLSSAQAIQQGPTQVHLYPNAKLEDFRHMYG